MFKVVIADDEAIILRNLKQIIPWNDLACEVVGTAKNGEEALSLCQEQQADLLLTDISMPGMTGLELLKQLNQLPKAPLAILISGYDEFEYAREGLKWRALDYILKPVDYEELQQCIQRAVNQLRNEAEKTYEMDKHHLHNLLITGSRETETTITSLSKPVVPILIEKQGQESAEQLDEKLFSSSRARHFWYPLSATMTLCLGEWSKEDIHLLYNDLCQRNLTGYRVLIGEPLTHEEQLKPNLETLQQWMNLHRLDGSVVFFTELMEKYQSKKTASDAIEKVISFIQEHYHEDIGAEQAAAYAEMSVSYFSLLFKQETGVTFLEYVTNYRIEKACFFLTHTKLKTYEIAEKVGYTDQRYFSQVFKKRLHQTPSEYRKQHAEF